MSFQGPAKESKSFEGVRGNFYKSSPAVTPRQTASIPRITNSPTMSFRGPAKESKSFEGVRGNFM